MTKELKAMICEMFYHGLLNTTEIADKLKISNTTVSGILTECLGLGRKDNPVIITKESKV